MRFDQQPRAPRPARRLARRRRRRLDLRRPDHRRARSTGSSPPSTAASSSPTATSASCPAATSRWRCRPGLASIVTYTDGTTDIGAWGNGVPDAPQARLLGAPEPAAARRSRRRGGDRRELHHRLLGRDDPGPADRSPARASASRPTAQLVWAAGEHLTPAELAQRAASAPGSCARSSSTSTPTGSPATSTCTTRPGPAAVAVVPGQLGIPGELLAPYTRDFFAVVAN